MILRKVVITTEKLILKWNNINRIKSMLIEKDGEKQIILILETAMLTEKWIF